MVARGHHGTAALTWYRRVPRDPRIIPVAATVGSFFPLPIPMGEVFDAPVRFAAATVDFERTIAPLRTWCVLNPGINGVAIVPLTRSILVALVNTCIETYGLLAVVTVVL